MHRGRRMRHSASVGRVTRARLNDPVTPCEALVVSKRPPWNGRIFLDAGVILYVGPGSAADHHAHHAVQLVWSLDGLIDVELDGKAVQRNAVLIPANTPHSLQATGRTIALFLVESHGARGAALDRSARRDIGGEVQNELAPVDFPRADVESSTWCERAISRLAPDVTRTPLSSISRRAIDLIERSIDGVPRVADVAQALKLSPTRITHVFSQEVGIPFRRFVLWTRIKRAVTAFQVGNDLTASAIAAGFSDAAHFSRTFKEMFGLSPSLVLPLAEVSGTIAPE